MLAPVVPYLNSIVASGKILNEVRFFNDRQWL